jgi:4-carboxymuconolactone decarboxylase
MTGAPVAMETHIGAALSTGDISLEEMQEFVVHFAAYAGHPNATAARTALDAARKAALAAARGEHPQTG